MLYDKLDWYSGDDWLYEHMTGVFKALWAWLLGKGLVAEDLRGAYTKELGSDFGLDDKMLTAEGNALFKAHYTEWHRSGQMFETPVQFTVLEEGLKSGFPKAGDILSDPDRHEKLLLT